MNKPITDLIITEDSNGGLIREFSIIFKPDPEFEMFDLHMQFSIVSVNRKTGEVKFKL